MIFLNKSLKHIKFFILLIFLFVQFEGGVTVTINFVAKRRGRTNDPTEELGGMCDAETEVVVGAPNGALDAVVWIGETGMKERAIEGSLVPVANGPISVIGTITGLTVAGASRDL